MSQSHATERLKLNFAARWHEKITLLAFEIYATIRSRSPIYRVPEKNPKTHRNIKKSEQTRNWFDLFLFAQTQKKKIDRNFPKFWNDLNSGNLDPGPDPLPSCDYFPIICQSQRVLTSARMRARTGPGSSPKAQAYYLTHNKLDFYPSSKPDFHQSPFVTFLWAQQGKLAKIS